MSDTIRFRTSIVFLVALILCIGIYLFTQNVPIHNIILYFTRMLCAFAVPFLFFGEYSCWCSTFGKEFYKFKNRG